MANSGWRVRISAGDAVMIFHQHLALRAYQQRAEGFVARFQSLSGQLDAAAQMMQIFSLTIAIS